VQMQLALQGPSVASCASSSLATELKLESRQIDLP